MLLRYSSAVIWPKLWVLELELFWVKFISFTGGCLVILYSYTPDCVLDSFRPNFFLHIHGLKGDGYRSSAVFFPAGWCFITESVEHLFARTIALLSIKPCEPVFDYQSWRPILPLIMCLKDMATLFEHGSWRQIYFSFQHDLSCTNGRWLTN